MTGVTPDARVLQFPPSATARPQDCPRRHTHTPSPRRRRTRCHGRLPSTNCVARAALLCLRKLQSEYRSMTRSRRTKWTARMARRRASASGQGRSRSAIGCGCELGSCKAALRIPAAGRLQDSAVRRARSRNSPNPGPPRRLLPRTSGSLGEARRRARDNCFQPNSATRSDQSGRPIRVRSDASLAAWPCRNQRSSPFGI